MALFVLIVLVTFNSFTCLIGSQIMQPEVENELEITPSEFTGGRYFGLYEVSDTLNLSCIFSNEFHLSNVVLDWILPSKMSNRLYQSQYLVIKSSPNLANLVIENLTESDSGEYKCTATVKSQWNVEKSIGISVKNKKGECPDAMFQCSFGNCIHKRYTCDGRKDCRLGEDELSNYCGPGNPCYNKLRCPDGRCIPYAWCCDSDRERNCTTKVKHRCCIQMAKLTRDVDSDLGFQYEQHKFNGYGFLQTTVYTVIGCAMAFMFIVTIIVIATCRIHMRRSLVTRCPAANNRNVNLSRTPNLHGNQLNYLPFYDLDVYFNRPTCTGNDLASVNPLLVTYNINNGVQFVGRPIDPPPYCEVLTSPPREGPPPPYASQENLSRRRDSDEPKESLDAGVESEGNETEALLGTSAPNQISVISCNAIDSISRGERSAEFSLPAGRDTPRLSANRRGSVRNGDNDTKNISKCRDSCNRSQRSECSPLRDVDISGSPKSDALSILGLNNRESDPESGGTHKIQTDGSNSKVSSNAADDNF